MAPGPPSDTTQLLGAIEGGDVQAAGQLLPLVYGELRALAQRKMKAEPAGHTLQATALVHEAYLRLVQSSDVQWKDRRHFFATAAEAMRRILIERARRGAGPRRGGGRKRVALEGVELTFDTDPDQMLALDEKLCELERNDPKMSEVVKLRFFAGLSVEETAAALDISPWTVKRQWRSARAWLYQQLNGGEASDGRAGQADT